MTSTVARNAIANVFQMLIGAILLFVLYRYISTVLGVDKLGVWSVVLATASASRLADLGLSAGVTRFVARYLALVQPQKAAQVVETGVVTLAVVVAVVLATIYPLLGWLLTRLFDAEYLSLAVEILPFAMISMWLTVVASVAQSGLDGCQRMVPRAALVLAGQGLMVMLAFALVPQLGLLGLAWAQIGQGAFLLVVGWLLLRGGLPELSSFPWRWNRPVFREMLGYGANVQVANILMLLFDPLTKALMAKFGGPAAAGYFEIANQVVLRARSLIVAANQAIVPKVAQMMEATPMRMQDLYRENVRLLVLIALPIHALLFAWGGLLSSLLLDTHQSQFIFFLQLSALAWLINTFSAPAYFMNMGAGSVALNTVAHVVMGVINLLLGWILGELYGAAGVAWGYALSLMTGSLLLIFIFQSRHAIGWEELIRLEHAPLAAVCLAVTFVGFLNLGFSLTRWSGYTGWGVTVVLPLLSVSVALWAHPLRSGMWEQFFGVTKNSQKR